ncbi:zinc finger MYM-type protein 1-like [Aphis craccivora]|uniref:Zinc finger MYM-type protein 1-like n=1 Tax=Aphis craccivora TaxID=307492 RepID=A0A6G0YCQ7_APHCR|nr:zinc finger MYM-type protein 1-like [Aphis craccivora]
MSIGENMDISGVELYDELCLLSEIIEKGTSPLEVLQKILSNSVGDVYSNIPIALRIMLTLPVTTATAERLFSKLKLIKNYLRTTLNQEKTTNLMILLIHLLILSQEKIIFSIKQNNFNKGNKGSLE